MRPPLAIAVGDPAGVGPRVTIEALSRTLGGDRAILFGDPVQLDGLAREEGLPTAELDQAEQGLSLPSGGVGIVSSDPLPREVIDCHRPTPEGGAAQLEALREAIRAVVGGRARCLVTGPTSKEAVVASGTPFRGQTEYLARSTSLEEDAVTMMFLGPRLQVSLVTTHLSVTEAARSITKARVARSARHLAEAVVRLRPPSEGQATIVVTGLNPHAGEGGLFGDEEERAILPGIAAARAAEPFSTGRARLEGPWPAERALREAAVGKVAGVVAMLHDQATIASKLLDWGEAVNVTWGLPFVRCSVDHGVAYDAAALGAADPSGMVAAISLAQRLATSR